MSTSFKQQLALPFLKTDLILTSWRDQFAEGVKFFFSDDSILLIRQMIEEDITDVFNLEQKIFSDPWPLAAFYTELRDIKYGLAVVGIIDDKIIAYATMRFIVDELHIHNIAVDIQNRRKGYGSALLWFILEIASQSNIKICYLEVRRSNLSALALYRKFGFKIIGVRKRYYIKQNEDALLMSKYI